MYLESTAADGPPDPGGLDAALGVLDGEDSPPTAEADTNTETNADEGTEPDFDNPQKPWVRPSSPD